MMSLEGAEVLEESIAPRVATCESANMMESQSCLSARRFGLALVIVLTTAEDEARDLNGTQESARSCWVQVSIRSVPFDESLPGRENIRGWKVVVALVVRKYESRSLDMF